MKKRAKRSFFKLDGEKPTDTTQQKGLHIFLMWYSVIGAHWRDAWWDLHTKREYLTTFLVCNMTMAASSKNVTLCYDESFLLRRPVQDRSRKPGAGDWLTVLPNAFAFLGTSEVTTCGSGLAAAQHWFSRLAKYHQDSSLFHRHHLPHAQRLVHNFILIFF